VKDDFQITNSQTKLPSNRLPYSVSLTHLSIYLHISTDKFFPEIELRSKSLKTILFCLKLSFCYFSFLLNKFRFFLSWLKSRSLAFDEFSFLLSKAKEVYESENEKELN
jgi:hypothetical protein